MHTHELATFAGGCFWGVEDVLAQIEGVVEAVSGYTGGHTENPTYEQVCRGDTGHAEAVQITFDPEKVSYEQLLQAFWSLHNPTSKNRQGPDVGTQYRSAIFYHSPEQKVKAEASKEALEKSGKYSQPIATEIVAAGPFYPAEEYHQQYLKKHGLGACHL